MGDNDTKKKEKQMRLIYGDCLEEMPEKKRLLDLVPKSIGYTGETGRDWGWRTGMRPSKYNFPEQWKTKGKYDENFDNIDWSKK